jgi:hypothetical protein
MSEPASSATASAPVRPPDFLLPQAIPRPRSGEPEIYLSWGGTVYGPAGTKQVLAGVRTAWFEPDALFWFEGQAGWRPVAEFPALFDQAPTDDPASPLVETTPPDAPTRTAPAPAPADRAARRRRRDGKHRPAKSPRRRGRTSRALRLIILVFILLAAVATVGIIFLLMQL